MLKIISTNELESVNTYRSESDQNAERIVKKILNDVRTNKDIAVRKYTEMFDHVSLEDITVSKEEVELAYKNTDSKLIDDLTIAYNNIYQFHQRQLLGDYKYEMEEDSVVGQLVRPISRVGIYVPGGTAAYPSTVLMNAVPALVAGVQEIVMITPPNKNGKIPDIILTAAKIAGIKEIYKIGGAQGVAALAYGTETIRPVSKIVGPGNIYVALAKREVYGTVGIDMIAGPSEILIFAQKNNNPRFIAADLLSQAEHDKLARVLLVTESECLVEEVNKEIQKQLNVLDRKEIARSALENNGFAVIVKNRMQAVEVINSIAPEHLELLIDNPEELIPFIINAGAIFVGEYSPEPLGDYIAGPNHTLPTSGNARFSSPLSTNDFMKTISYINFTKKGLGKYQESIRRIATKEGLTAHANAIKVRF